ELAVPGAAELLVEEDRPEALLLDLVLEVLDQGFDLRVLRPHGVREDRVERFDLFAAKFVDPVELLLELGLGREIPRHRLTPSSNVLASASLPPGGMKPPLRQSAWKQGGRRLRAAAAFSSSAARRRSGFRG